MPPLTQLVSGIEKRFGPKKDLVLLDNNVVASSRFSHIITEIRDLGFTPGATLHRSGRRPIQRRVDFNQGLDARLLAKSPRYLQEMATVALHPLRVAFDHLGLRKVYERTMRSAVDCGLTQLSNYLLYNFHDTPGDLYERMRINLALNEELGLRIWSFPMRYQPVTLKDRSHVGSHWSRRQLRSFPLMLQASHGVVSGNSSFFRYAYGESTRDFEYLLSLPHPFLFFFHRKYYEEGDGRAVRDEYHTLRKRLSPSQTQELMGLLNGPEMPRSRPPQSRIDPRLPEILAFYTSEKEHPNMHPGSHPEPLPLFPDFGSPDLDLPPPEERVEDAGLFDPSTESAPQPS